MNQKLLAAALFLLLVQTGNSQNWSNLGTILPNTHVELSDYFGTSISIGGDAAVIGAPSNSDHRFNGGKVFVFKKIAGVWVKQTELAPSSPSDNENFGNSVLIDGDYIFVGAANHYVGAVVGAGAVYVFKSSAPGATTYDEVGLLTASDPSNSALFGWSIAKHGDYFLVGAYQGNGAVDHAGAAYLFHFDGTNYQFQTKISRQLGTAGEYFGTAVALNGTHLFIGAPYWDSQHAYGAVFVYDLATRDSVATLTFSDYQNTFGFGASLAATDHELAVSAPYTGNPDGSYGTACLFQEGAGWTSRAEDFKFVPQAPITDYGLYGWSLALNDTVIAVGTRSGNNVDLIQKGASGWSDATRVNVLSEPNVGTTPSQFGSSLALGTTDLLIGAANLTRPGTGTGIVFAYQGNGTDWSSLTQLADINGASFGAGADHFGGSVDVNGDYAVVGGWANFYGEQSLGTAQVFHRTGTVWTRVATLTSTDRAQLDLFGQSVSITADRVVVGASNADYDGTTSGRVYVFEKPAAGWSDMTETSVILPANPNMGQGFGYRVVAVGQEIAVTHYSNSGSDVVGEAYIFTKQGSTWNLKAKFDPSDAANNSNEHASGFGSSLAYDGSTLAVGAPWANVGRPGQVYVFEKPAGDWVNATETAILFPSDPLTLGFFGTSLDIDQNTLIVGAPQGFGGAQGEAYIFEKGAHWQSGTETAKLPPATSAAFGSAVAISGHYSVVGSSVTGVASTFSKLSGQWTPLTDLVQVNTPTKFGAAIGLSGDNLVVGDPAANTAVGGGSGQVTFYLADPTVSLVTSSNANGSYILNQTVNVKVIFSQPVTVTGNPLVDLAMYGAGPRQAIYGGLAGDGGLNFTYTIAENDTTPDLNYVNPNSLTGTYTIASVANGATAITTLPPVASLTSLGGQKDIVINGKKTITGIETKPDLSVYPNPFDTRLFVDGSDGDAGFQITDISGRTVVAGTVNSTGIDTSQLPTGLYILELNASYGTTHVKVVRR